VPSSSASAGVRYRTRGEERRDHRFELKLSAAERIVLAAAAERAGQTLAAYLVKAGLDRAEHRIAPVGAVQREMLARLMALAEEVAGIKSSLSQAATRSESAGIRRPDIEYCMRVVRHIDEAAELIRQRRLR
jgi:uncharacterized protein (DUF1778 family)